MTSVTGRPGRPAAAARQDVLTLAEEHFLAGERIDMQRIARDLGLARATVHRWFGTREALLGELLAGMVERRLALLRERVGGSGAAALLQCFDTFNRDIVATQGLGIWLGQEQDRALRILTSSGGVVQPRAVAAIQGLIEVEVEQDAYLPAIAPSSLAYAIVRLAEAFLYNDAIVGVRGDTVRLREVEAALLGAPEAAAGPGASD